MRDWLRHRAIACARLLVALPLQTFLHHAMILTERGIDIIE
jgi:hypothetical protein